MKCIKVISVVVSVLVLTLITLKSQTGRAAEVGEHIWKTVDLSNK
ncbi:hypothetical protein [Paenibacillus sp. VTT E-133280]|nr:hypothetical protein [Paenibacillus sp. VTT E-133280]